MSADAGSLHTICRVLFWVFRFDQILVIALYFALHFDQIPSCTQYRRNLFYFQASNGFQPFFNTDQLSWRPSSPPIGRTPQGVRGLKLYASHTTPCGSSRTPQGVRGLKPVVFTCHESPEESHSARSAWIETGYIGAVDSVAPSRTPQGVRGLKQFYTGRTTRGPGSHSARSAWIETGKTPLPYGLQRSHSARSAWIET